MRIANGDAFCVSFESQYFATEELAHARITRLRETIEAYEAKWNECCAADEVRTAREPETLRRCVALDAEYKALGAALIALDPEIAGVDAPDRALLEWEIIDREVIES